MYIKNIKNKKNVTDYECVHMSLCYSLPQVVKESAFPALHPCGLGEGDPSLGAGLPTPVGLKTRTVPRVSGDG